MVWRGGVTRKILLEGEVLIFNREVGNISKMGELDKKRVEEKIKGMGSNPQKTMISCVNI